MPVHARHARMSGMNRHELLKAAPGFAPGFLGRLCGPGWLGLLAPAPAPLFVLFLILLVVEVLFLRLLLAILLLELFLKRRYFFFERDIGQLILINNLFLREFLFFFLRRFNHSACACFLVPISRAGTSGLTSRSWFQ